MVNFNIQFDKPDKTYKAGETIHCKISISVVERFKVRKLYFRFHGAGRTIQWGKNGNNDGREEFISHFVYLVGTDYGPETEIKPGDYTYEACFKLPKDLPSSLDKMLAYIRYSVKLCYDVPIGFDKEVTEKFFVKAELNLNDFPHLTEKVQTTTQKNFGYWFWKSDPLKLTNILPKKGWIPGETIPITIEVNNNSDVKIEKIMVYLFEKITYFAAQESTNPRRNKRLIKTHKINTPIEPYQNKVLEAKILLDPNEKYIILNQCTIISAEYYIESFAKAAGFHMGLKNNTNIMICTSPLNDVASTSSAISPTAPVEVKETGR